MFVATKDKALQTTTTGALPRPSWYTENLGGQPLSVGFSKRAYRDQHLDCLAANVAMQHKAGTDIMVDGDCRLDDDWAGRSWVAYPLERIDGIGSGRLELQPANFLSADRGPGDLIRAVGCHEQRIARRRGCRRAAHSDRRARGSPDDPRPKCTVRSRDLGRSYQPRGEGPARVH